MLYKELVQFAIDRNWSKRENLCQIKVPRQFNNGDANVQMRKSVYTSSVFKVLLDSVMDLPLILNSVGNYVRVRDVTFPSVEKKLMVNFNPDDIMRAHVDLQ